MIIPRFIKTPYLPDRPALLLIAVLCSVLSGTAQADDTTPIADQATSQAVAEQPAETAEEAVADNSFFELPAPVAEKSAQYQACVTAVMSTLSSVATQRTQLAADCDTLKAALVAVFPEEIQALMASNIDRRLETVLYAIEQMEGTVSESAEDTLEIAQEIKELEQLPDE